MENPRKGGAYLEVETRRGAEFQKVEWHSLNASWRNRAEAGNAEDANARQRNICKQEFHGDRTQTQGSRVKSVELNNQLSHGLFVCGRCEGRMSTTVEYKRAASAHSTPPSRQFLAFDNLCLLSLILRAVKLLFW